MYAEISDIINHLSGAVFESKGNNRLFKCILVFKNNYLQAHLSCRYIIMSV